MKKLIKGKGRIEIDKKGSELESRRGIESRKKEIEKEIEEYIERRKRGKRITWHDIPAALF